MANLVCRGLDLRLMSIAEKTGVIFTRYADDMAFSGEKIPTLAEIAIAVEAEGFQLSARKKKLTKLGQAHFVTGLSIQDPSRPHVPRLIKRKLRQQLYYCAKHSTQDHFLRTKHKVGEGINQLDGMIRYVSFIERGTSFDFRAEWERLQSRDDVSPSVGADYRKEHVHYFVAVDESIIEIAGRHILAVGFALYEDENAVDSVIREVLENYHADPYAAGKKADITKRGLHYVDAHPALRATFIERLPMVPVRTLVGLTDLPVNDAEAKSQAYQHVFGWGYTQLCKRADRGQLTFRIEDSNIIDRGVLASIVKDAYALLTATGMKRPTIAPEILFVTKTVAAVAVPDFMLGILGAYVKAFDASGEKIAKGELSVREFERVRDRFTLIHDLDTKHYYSRRNPLRQNSLSERPT